jgi:uncharacterized protein (TIGR02594 family)
MTEDPKWLELARAELGDREGRDDAKILSFFRDAGHAEIDGSDTAWCAAYAGAMLHRAGVKPSGSLMARSYLRWGQKLDVGADKIGCIAVLWRGSPEGSEGHVGFVTEVDADFIKLLGGNQGAAGIVSIETFPRSRVLGFRWPENQEKSGAETVKTLPANNVKLAQPKQGTTDMNPFSLLTTFVSAVLPQTAPGTPSAGIVTPIGQASSSLLSVAVGMLLAGLGATSFGADAIHTLSTIAGVLLAGLSAANHIGLLGANNANTEALAEQLLKQVSDAGKPSPEA